MGLAAQHAQRYGHQAWVETGYHHELTPDGIEPIGSTGVSDPHSTYTVDLATGEWTLERE